MKVQTTEETKITVPVNRGRDIEAVLRITGQEFTVSILIEGDTVFSTSDRAKFEALLCAFKVLDARMPWHPKPAQLPPGVR